MKQTWTSYTKAVKKSKDCNNNLFYKKIKNINKNINKIDKYIDFIDYNDIIWA